MGSVNVATIATSISNYSVSGVTLKDIDEIPENVTDRQCPLMFPNPDGFVSSLEVSRESIGLDSTAKKNVTYTLNYVFLQAPVGAYRTLAQAEAEMTDNIVLILNALTDNSAPSGAIDIVPSVGSMGVATAPGGDEFFGAQITINVLTFYEVNS